MAVERMRAMEKRIEELENLKETKLTEEEGGKAEARKCPRCGKGVGWDSLPVETELPNPWFPLPFRLKSTTVVKGKRCPSCWHIG